MPASYYQSITDEMIQERLDSISSVSVWSLGIPLQLEFIQEYVNEKFHRLTAEDVRYELYKDLCGNSEQEEIEMAISLACQSTETWNEEWYVKLKYRQ